MIPIEHNEMSLSITFVCITFWLLPRGWKIVRIFSECREYVTSFKGIQLVLQRNTYDHLRIKILFKEILRTLLGGTTETGGFAKEARSSKTIRRGRIIFKIWWK